MSTDRRTPLARARGLGSAHAGVGHWWRQRLTAAALVPLGLWLAVALVRLSGAPHATVQAWLAAPWNAIAMLLLLAVAALHLALGLQVVVEDYVHRKAAAVALRGLVTAGCLGLVAVGGYAVLHVAFGR